VNKSLRDFSTAPVLSIISFASPLSCLGGSLDFFPLLPLERFLSILVLSTAPFVNSQQLISHLTFHTLFELGFRLPFPSLSRSFKIHPKHKALPSRPFPLPKDGKSVSPFSLLTPHWRFYIYFPLVPIPPSALATGLIKIKGSASHRLTLPLLCIRLSPCFLVTRFFLFR